MFFRFASAAALAATASMVAAPLAASELPQAGAPTAFVPPSVLGTNAVNANDHRRWRHHDGVDAGDVVAGVAVVGVIAALASAVSKQSERDRARTQGYPYPDRPYDYRANPSDPHYDDSRGIDRAVEACAREVERSGAIDTVDTVERTESGWHVAGRRQGGAAFDCSVGNDGRIEGLDNGRIGEVDGQWDDDRYAAARQSQDGGTAAAYPGAPADGDADDGRYDVDETPGT